MTFPVNSHCRHARFAKLCICLALSLALHSPALAQDIRQQIADYQQAIAELDGSYDAASPELFLSLARAQTTLGDYGAAGQAYQEALQALRVNAGLASETQLQILAPYNAILFELQDWQQLDTNYHLAYDISNRLYGSDDARTISAATRLASWKIRAWQTNVYRPRGDRSVQEATEIYRKLLDELDEDSAATAQLRATWLSARGLAYFYSARHVANIPVNEFQRSVSVSSSFQQCIPIVLSVDGAQPSANACQANQNLDPEFYASQQREKNNQVRRHLSNMRQSFEEAIAALEQSPQTTKEQRVQAILNLGDANLLAEDYQRARSQYARAWDLLSADPEDLALRERLLGKPVRALQGILEALPFDEPLAGEALLGVVAFDVTADGQLNNINVGGTPAALEQDNVGAIAVKLDQSVYRPKIEDGRPVISRLSLPAAEL